MILMIDNYDSFTITKEKPTEGGFITTQLIESALTQSSAYFHNQTDHWYYPITPNYITIRTNQNCHRFMNFRLGNSGAIHIMRNNPNHIQIWQVQ